jgi:hypothetical protein
VLTRISIVLEKVSDYKNRDYFIEKIGKDVEYGTQSGLTISASVRVDGIRYDFSITDENEISANHECYVLFNAKNKHVFQISKGEKVDFKERMMHELRWYAKLAMLWVAALTVSFLYYRLVDKRITKKWKESEKQRNAKKR